MVGIETNARKVNHNGDGFRICVSGPFCGRESGL